MYNANYVRMLNRAAREEAARLHRQHELVRLATMGQRSWIVRLFERILRLKPRAMRSVPMPVHQTQTSLRCSP